MAGKKKESGIPEDAQIVEWHEAVPNVNPSSKAELQWLHKQLQICGIRSISDIENMIVRAE